MGCSYGYQVNEKNIVEDIKNFNEKYKDMHEDNTILERFSEDITLHHIEQEGFNSLTHIEFDSLINLYLNENNIENIQSLGHFKAPFLKHLDLSYNKIKNIDIFKKVNFPLLADLDLSNNVINNIDIFQEENILKKLKNLFLNNNDIDFENKKVKNIIEKLEERMALNNEDSCVEYNNDETFILSLQKIKTFNYKLKTSFGIYDKDVIKEMRKIVNLSESDESIINK